jgi:hypothetical protein
MRPRDPESTMKHSKTRALILVCTSVLACAPDDVRDEEAVTERGLSFANGLSLGNGLSFANGLKLANGLSFANGLTFANGLKLANGLSFANGLDPNVGIMTSAAGQTFVKYLVECALPSGDSITKTDVVNGGTITFNGMIGLAPEWKTGSCGTQCQEWVSSCLMARTNAKGLHINIDARATHPALGLKATAPRFIAQEAAFYGNLWANPPKAYTCIGRDALFGVFGGRTCSDGVSCGFSQVGEFCVDECNNAKKGEGFSTCPAPDKNYTSVITVFLDPNDFSVGCPPGCSACEDGACQIACTGDVGCAGQHRECPDGMDCEVWCTGRDTCKDASFAGPADGLLTMDCRGDGACKHVDVSATDDVALACNGVRACDGLDVDGPAGAVELTCGTGTDVCKNTSVH